jgi:hypothetical protein
MKLQNKRDAMRDGSETLSARADPSELLPVLDRLRAGVPA